jgi:hypothetical protein
VVNTRISHTGGPGFESRPRDQAFWDIHTFTLSLPADDGINLEIGHDGSLHTLPHGLVVITELFDAIKRADCDRIVK